MKFVRSTVAMAVLATFGLGAAGTAQAGAYAYAYNDIFNLQTTFVCSDTNTAGCISITSYQASSSADADLQPPVGGVASSDTVAATTAGNTFPVTKNPDVPVQWQSSAAAPANNLWSAVGKTAYDYARGDAQIVSQQIAGAPTTQVKNLAEGNLVANIDSSAVANGQNTSTTGYSVTFTTTSTWSVSFLFDALPFIEALITTPGATATGDLDVSFTINLIETIPGGGTTTTQVFNWQPNGVVGAITGGTETTDDATLNIELADTVLDGSSAIYNPAATDADCTVAGGCQYAASSNSFGAGTYNLILTMHEGVVMTNTAVPVPAPLALMGLGLAALGFVNRRSKKA